mmetsp:Transcript_21703/g.32314  ORF Transcript_21703/g.32314 Transcript_21703/m.32314 type:complete len:100 (+) Transcript_21703:38-337(+)
MPHTIVLMRLKDEKQNTWSQYTSESDAFDGVCRIFEARLKKENPGTRKITYDIKDLFSFIEEAPDMAFFFFFFFLSAGKSVTTHAWRAPGGTLGRLFLS